MKIAVGNLNMGVRELQSIPQPGDFDLVVRGALPDVVEGNNPAHPAVILPIGSDVVNPVAAVYKNAIKRSVGGNLANYRIALADNRINNLSQLP